MTHFNADFWEVTLEAEHWGQFSQEDGLWYEHPERVAERERDAQQAEVLWPRVHEIMLDVLTERQCEIVGLYFFAEMNQREIAERLGISQQSICEHLYGKRRGGRTVGGALRKLRKACAARGIRWE